MGKQIQAARGVSGYSWCARTLILAGVILALAPAAGWAQPLSRTVAPLLTSAAALAPDATITEGFDAGLACPADWTCVNNSTPVGSQPNWFNGNVGVFAAQAGAGYIGANLNMVAAANTISAWLISPVMQFGDGAELRFWSRTNANVFPDRLEIRSSSGGVDTGGTNTSVGDFTNVLGTINPTLVATAGTCVSPAAAPNAGGYPTAWCEYRLTNADGIPLSGTGRIAFRYFVTNGGPDGANSDYIGIDTFSFVEGAVPPTFDYVPAPGFTVNATGGTVIGSTGSLAITPSVAIAGNGSGAAATTTLTCTAPTAPFSGFGQTATAVGAGAISGGPLSGSCTLGAGIVTQTLTCNENRGGTSASQQWTLSCPAGTCPPTVVSNGNDSGAGSLRQVIADACAGSTITFASGVSTIGLTTAQLLIAKNLTIDGGAGVSVTRVTGSPNFRIFEVGSGSTVLLDSLTLSNGSADAGGIILNRGNLTILDAVISGGTANNGGGIYSLEGILQVSDSTITGNIAANVGGGIINVGFSNAASAIIINSSIIDNRAQFAAGVQNQGADLLMTNCTVANNVATGSDPAGVAGGLDNVAVGFATTATLVNCTFNGNRDSSIGTPQTSAIYSGNFGTQSTVNLKNTILGGSAASTLPNLRVAAGGIIVSQGNNLSSDSGAGVLTGPGDLINLNPLLAIAGSYGGSTPTLAVLPGSPAINAGTVTGAPTTDQRGVARVGAVDIGAFESRGFTLALTGGNNQSAGPGLAFANPLTATVTAVSPGEPVQGGVVSFAPPGAGASASLAPNPATIGAGGVASTTATANATVGAYNVAASSNGATPSLTYTLTNAGADLSIDDVTIAEGDAATSNAVFTVMRTNSLTAFSVPYNITAGTAQAGSDYTATSGTLTFAVGGPLTQTITVPVVGDLIVETTETATLNLGAVTNTIGVTTTTDGSGLLTITDNDSAVVAFNPVSVSQTEAITPMAFTVTLSNPVQSGVTLGLNSAFGTATAADFTPIVGGTVTFAPNTSASQTVNVVIINDALDEDDEQFTLTLSGLTAVGNVTPGALVATGTIVDDDLPPVISITSPSQPEGNGGLTPMDFVVSLSAVSGRDVTFTRATADGTATVGNNDYQPLAPLLITIPAGQLSNTQTVQIVGDTVFEGDESFNLNLTNIVNATPALPPTIEGAPVGLTGTGTIEDDDQQPTTTTISSDDPDASVVGQPYTVVVNVEAVTTSPLGTVTISDGTDSCGPVTLTTGTAPNSSASCVLTSTTAGAKTLTASYTAASTAFADSSGTTTHQVNAALTAISVVGPARSRINQPTSFTFALSVEAPGAGSPAGTVTLSSGTASCNVTVPTATPSCALTFDALGLRTVSAVFVPSDGNFLGSSSSGAGNAQTLVFALSDIAVTKSDGLGTFRPGDLVVYTVTVRNLGADAAAQIRVIDNVPAGLVDVVWTCDASGGVACPQAGGSGNLDMNVASFPIGGLLNVTFYGNVDGNPAQLVNTALVQLPADATIEDPVPGNNSATDTNLLELLFRNGFEAVAVNAPAGSFRLPSASLRGSLDEVAVVVYVLDDADGEALRVYARVIGDEVQYALAMRNGQGRLRLGAWASYADDPLLTWTARPVAEGWVLDSAALR
jgi:uncharacterized repeat protein (TIGR01451 family)